MINTLVEQKNGKGTMSQVAAAAGNALATGQITDSEYREFMAAAARNAASSHSSEKTTGKKTTYSTKKEKFKLNQVK